MIDEISISYTTGASLVKASETEIDEDTTYRKWDYVLINNPDMSLSPLSEGWLEKDSVSNLFFPTDDISVEPEKDYYVYDLVEVYPEEGDNPAELGWFALTEPEVIREPTSTLSIEY